MFTIMDDTGADVTAAVAADGLTIEQVPASDTGGVEKFWKLVVDKTKEG